MSDDPKICPVHGLHGKWHNGWCAKEEPPGSNEYCMHDPIAPEIVQAIEARAIARERIAVVEAVAEWLENESKSSRRAAGLIPQRAEEHGQQADAYDWAVRELRNGNWQQRRAEGSGEHTTGPDYVAQHDARVRREALEVAAVVLHGLGQLLAAAEVRALAQQEDTE